MIRLLYIGEREDRLQKLQTTEGLALTQAKNVVAFDNLESELHQYDLVVSEYKLRGLDGDGIYDRYKSILRHNRLPFMIIDDHFTRSRKTGFLKEGISELLEEDFDPASLVSKADFYKEMLANRIERQRKKKRVTEYKIPLAKRLFDIVVAGIALLVISPVLILVIIAIKLESKGPFWYKSKRVGTGYKVFDFYKLRSMYTDADKRIKELSHLNQYASESSENEGPKKNKTRAKDDKVTLIYKDGTEMSEEEYLELKRQQAAGTFVKFKNDPRITKVGHFIRNTSIDELPQLINVLKGDMSIVGNRPLPLYEAEQLTSDDWGERFLAPAGITGLWQVEKRGKGEMSEEERKALDNQYAKNFSFWNDIKLILKTVPALFQKENV